jgi:hypothetical protein
MNWQPPPPPNEAKKPVVRLEGKNLYELLGVDRNAHPTVIRYAYRFLAALYHPDNAESGDAENFRIISDAWRVLSDSGKRQAYDMQLALSDPATAAQAQQASPTSPPPNAPRASVSWSEVELRLAVLQVLMQARRRRVQTGGATGKMIMDCLNCDMADMEWVLWYLRERNYITRTDRDFMITADGVDYVVDQLSRTQPLDTSNPSSPVNVNLPATL